MSNPKNVQKVTFLRKKGRGANFRFWKNFLINIAVAISGLPASARLGKEKPTPKGGLSPKMFVLGSEGWR